MLPRFGIRIPYEGDHVTGEIVQRVAKAADAAGFHSGWVGDHIAFPVSYQPAHPTTPDGNYVKPASEPRLEALTVLTFAAAATKNLKLGVGACIVPYREPILLAKTVASLDRLSNGRTIFCAAMGWLKEEFEALGSPYEKRRERLLEGVEIMRCLWEQPLPQHRGASRSFAPVHFDPKPTQKPMPVWFGGHSRPALERAAALGQGWLCSRIPPNEVEKAVSFIRSERQRLARTGSFDVGVTRLCAFRDESASLNIRDRNQVAAEMRAFHTAGADLVIFDTTRQMEEELLEIIATISEIVGSH